MKISDIEVFQIQLPPRREHPTAYRLGALGHYVIIRIHTDEGISGVGEATVLPQWGGDYQRYFGESPGTTQLIVSEFYKPLLLGEDPFAISALMEKLGRAVHGYPYARAAIDMALHDIKGKASNLPVYELLGGLYRREIPLAHSIAILETERVIREAEQAVAEGIRTIKLKVGRDPRRDVEVVREVRRALGPEIQITIDANRGYVYPKTAIATLREMAPDNVRFAEQVVEGIDGLARVARAVDVPVMADESAWTTHDVLEIIQKEAAELVSLYTTKPGGLLEAMRVAAVCQAGGLACNVNGSAETGVGTAANLHLCAAAPVVTEASVFPVTRLKGQEPTQVAGAFYLDDIITEPFEYRDGALLVPDKPGLGVELDMDKIEQYRVA